MLITNRTKGTALATNARLADTFWSRLVGLLGSSSLSPGEALVIRPCNAVHTAFMRFPIDVVYVDKQGNVAKTAPNMRPFRAGGLLRPPCSVIELPAGVISATSTVPGDEIIFSD